MIKGKSYPPAMISVLERKARWVIGIFSAIVFLAVVFLNRVQVPAPEGLDVHVFARINAMINSAVSLLLLFGLYTARTGRLLAHRSVMIAAMLLSVLFLLSYITHHLFAGDTSYGGQGAIRVAYYLILFSHIILAGTSLPFILFTAYRALTGNYPAHRRLARKVWPIWLYVSVSGVLVYWMISPYY